MAFFNEIGAGRYNRFIQKLFNMKGGPPARQLASDVAMVFSFFSGVENRNLEQWQRYTFGLTIAAGAANQSGFLLRNPSGSNVIAVIEKLNFVPRTQGDSFTLSNGAVTANLATLTGLSQARLDPRGNPTPSLLLSQQNTTPAIAGLPNTWARVASLQNTIIEMITHEDHELPVLPGDGYQVVEDTVNSALLGTIVWRERALEDSELK